RLAIARSDVPEVRRLITSIEQLRARRARGDPEIKEAARTEMVSLSPASRRFNQRYNARALEAFDDLTSRYEASVRQKRLGEAGVALPPLDPGRYTVRLADHKELTLIVPGPSVWVLPAKGDRSAGLVKEVLGADQK